MRRILTAALSALAVLVVGAAHHTSSANAAPLLAQAPVTSTFNSGAINLATSTDFSDHVQLVGKRKFIGFKFRHGHVYFKGHRGYRHYRSGYRYHRGYYFPRHAFSVRVAPKPRIIRRGVVKLTAAHVRWCYNRYKTYRHSDNTYAYKVGKRTYCRSPYSH